jgi:cytochrome c-type biogenesis protein CcmF
MIQERRGMLKVWNVVLICLTFFLTIFGTFLTRSGLIASVHSFAQSGIGIFFVYYMAVIVAVCAALIFYRLPKLQSEGAFESVLAREAAFLLNNWGFLSLMIFIAVATTFPMISEKLLDQKMTLGPTFYNQAIPLIALVVYAMMGVAPLLGWRKTSPELFKKSFRWPLVAMAVTAVAHLAFGAKLGFPAFVKVDPIWTGTLGTTLAKLAYTYPFVTIALTAFNIAVVVQEFVRGVSARQKSAEQKGEKESAVASLLHLVAKSRRRYGGYIVHVGIALMFIGFVGRGWSVDKEATLSPGETVQFEEYTVKYVGPRMEVDQEKRMIFADVDVMKGGKTVDRISPAKFIYKSMGESPSTEVARHVTVRDDLYMIIGMVNPQTKMAAFQMHVNTLISWIWAGALVLVFGTLIAMWPELALEEAGAWSYVRLAGGVATAVLFAFMLASGAGMAYADAPSRAPPAAKPLVAPVTVPAP